MQIILHINDEQKSSEMSYYYIQFNYRIPLFIMKFVDVFHKSMFEKIFSSLPLLFDTIEPLLYQQKGKTFRIKKQIFFSRRIILHFQKRKWDNKMFEY